MKQRASGKALYFKQNQIIRIEVFKMSSFLYPNETLAEWTSNGNDGFLTCSEDYEKFKDEINNAIRENNSFNHPYEFTEKVAREPRGYITLKSIFNSENYKYIAQPVNDIKDIIKNYGSWIVLTSRDFNSGDFSKSIETDIIYSVYYLYNPFNGQMIDLVKFRFCKEFEGGGPWSHDGNIIFYDEYGTQKELKSFLYNYYALANGIFYFNDIKYKFSVKGCMMNDSKPIYITNTENSKSISADLAQNRAVDLSKKRAVVYSIKELLNAKRGDKLNRMMINYVSIPENNKFLTNFDQNRLKATIYKSFKNKDITLY